MQTGICSSHLSVTIAPTCWSWKGGADRAEEEEIPPRMIDQLDDPRIQRCFRVELGAQEGFGTSPNSFY